MAAATLYILFTLADGGLKVLEKGFVDTGMCESYVSDVIKPRTDIATVDRYECVSLVERQSAPDWYTQHTPQKLIHGVPVLPTGR